MVVAGLALALSLGVLGVGEGCARSQIATHRLAVWRLTHRRSRAPPERVRRPCLVLMVGLQDYRGAVLSLFEYPIPLLVKVVKSCH